MKKSYLVAGIAILAAAALALWWWLKKKGGGSTAGDIPPAPGERGGTGGPEDGDPGDYTPAPDEPIEPGTGDYDDPDGSWDTGVDDDGTAPPPGSGSTPDDLTGDEPASGATSSSGSGPGTDYRKKYRPGQEMQFGGMKKVVGGSASQKQATVSVPRTAPDNSAYIPGAMYSTPGGATSGRTFTSTSGRYIMKVVYAKGGYAISKTVRDAEQGHKFGGTAITRAR